MKKEEVQETLDRAYQSIEWFSNVIDKQGRLPSIEDMRLAYDSLFRNNPNRLNAVAFNDFYEAFASAIQQTVAKNLNTKN